MARSRTNKPKFMSRAAERHQQHQLAMLRAVRGIDRDRHFEEGGSLVAWRGGTRTVIADKKKQSNKRTCRNFDPRRHDDR